MTVVSIIPSNHCLRMARVLAYDYLALFSVEEPLPVKKTFLPGLWNQPEFRRRSNKAHGRRTGQSLWSEEAYF